MESINTAPESTKFKLWLYYRTVPFYADIQDLFQRHAVPAAQQSGGEDSDSDDDMMGMRRTLDRPITARGPSDEVSHALKVFVEELVAESPDAREFRHIIMIPARELQGKPPVILSVDGEVHVELVHGGYDPAHVLDLLSVVEPWVGCTGHQSLNEVIAMGRIPFYELRSHLVPMWKAFEAAIFDFMAAKQAAGERQPPGAMSHHPFSVAFEQFSSSGKYKYSNGEEVPDSSHHKGGIDLNSQKGMPPASIDYDGYIKFMREVMTGGHMAEFVDSLPDLGQRACRQAKVPLGSMTSPPGGK